MYDASSDAKNIAVPAISCGLPQRPNAVRCEAPGASTGPPGARRLPSRLCQRQIFETAFNTPRTLEEILGNNDEQLFDLQSDPEEMRNLALEPETNRDTILRMNGLLNDLIAKEVGVNDGRFLAQLGVGSRALTGSDASGKKLGKRVGCAGCVTDRRSARNHRRSSMALGHILERREAS